MVGVKEGLIKELNIIPFDLTPKAIDEDHPLVIAQHPAELGQQGPMGISLGSCKKILGNQ